ncbi:MAG: hypothetical protein J4203_05085 [Candidatus Diapherotrites archaeon]|nr:hypothetical protein [Candidatus Diapherotrites archaeon]
MHFMGAMLAGQVSRSADTIRLHRLARDGHAKKEEFLASASKDAQAILKAQAQGFAFVSGGQVEWLDLFRPIAATFAGFERKGSEGEDAIGPVTRWFRTNTFYRKPHVNKRISAEGGELIPFLPKLPGKGLACLPAPYTFWRLVEHSYYQEPAEFAADYAAALAASAPHLKKHGYDCLLFLNPSVGYDLSRNQFQKLDWAADFFASLKKTGFTLGVHFPLADGSKALPIVEDSSVDFVGVDCIHTDFAKLHSKKDLFLGLVDAARIGVESPAHLTQQARACLQEAGFSGNFYLGPNDRLFEVPYEAGLDKVKSLAQAAKQLEAAK